MSRKNLDEHGRLRVGAAIGFFGDAWERAGALRDAGVDARGQVVPLEARKRDTL